MTECIKLKDPENDVSYLLWKITKFWQRGKHRLLDEFGLTSSQLEILGALYHLSKCEKEEVTQVILSQETDIDPMTVSTILRNLQKKGLVVRKESKVDTRARVVSLTSEGEELFVKAILKVKAVHDELFTRIDIDALKVQLKILLEELNRFNQ